MGALVCFLSSYTFSNRQSAFIVVERGNPVLQGGRYPISRGHDDDDASHPVDYGVHSRGLGADGEHRLTPMTSIVYDVPEDLETDAADRERGDTSYLSGSEALLR
jgi:hypothetical protein